VSEPALQLERDAFGKLVLTLGAQRVVGVVPVRCFAFSAPDEWISLCDEKGHEVHCLERLDSLEGEQRQLIEAELAAREFIPVIERIHLVSPGSEPTQWKVATDRGEVEFTLPSEDNVRRLGTHGALVSDSEGVRYRILDTRRMDAKSRRILNQYL
jgi:hypothetical protein